MDMTVGSSRLERYIASLDAAPSAGPGSLFDIAGAVALVTGGTRGIGRAIADGLADAGAVVALTGRDAAGVQQVVEAGLDRGVQLAGLTWEATEPQAADQLVERVVAEHGRLDILVNNAGMIERGPAETHAVETWEQIISANLTGTFALSAAAGRVMLSQGYGRMVNIASVLAFGGGRAVAAYAASKGGVVQLTRSLAAEWSDRGVTVNAIAAGYIDTDLTSALRADSDRQRQLAARIPARRFGRPDELVGPTIFLCSRAASYVTGAILAVDGGWLAA
jgi:2-dehydro-3-deoxy-D-gluconate 5-dehydrogenase